MAKKTKISKRPFSRKFSSYQTAKGKKATAKYPEIENMSLEEGTEYLKGMRTGKDAKGKPRQRRSKADTGLGTFRYKPGLSGK